MGVGFIKWNKNGLCGAACAQMILHARYLVNDSRNDQDAIWTKIQGESDGTSPGPCCAPVPIDYPTMIREQCAGKSCTFCWETFPTVLKKVLGGYLGKSTTVKLRKTGNEDTANSIIKTCLGRGGIAIVLVDGGTHWVVVDDWDSASSTPISLLDPAYEVPTTIDLDSWNIDRMVNVDCGRYDNKLVVMEVG